MSARFIPEAMQDVVTTADPILQEDAEAQRSKMAKVMEPVGEQELTACVPLLGTLHPTPQVRLFSGPSLAPERHLCTSHGAVTP